MADVQGPGIVRLYYDAVGVKDGTPWAIGVEGPASYVGVRLASNVHIVDVEGRTRPFDGKYVLEFHRAIVVWGSGGIATICPYPKTATVP